MRLSTHRGILRKLTNVAAFALVLGLLPMVLPGRAEAQGAGGSVTVKGQVLDRSSGRPVAGAHVSFPASHREAVTDGRGNFIVDGVSAGPQPFVVAREGYATSRQMVDLAPGERLITIRLRPDAAAFVRAGPVPEPARAAR